MVAFNHYCESISMYSDISSTGYLYSPTIDHILTDNTSSLSDAGTPSSISINSNCDEDDNGNGNGNGVIMLASSHPKKRTGRKKFKETRHPVYRGVRMRNSNRWVCEIREPNKRNRIWLGTYPTAVMAARAHDVAALALRGLKGCLNFADSAWRLPKPASSDSEDIQRAAAEAAAMFSVDQEEEEYKDDGDNLVEESVVINSSIDDDDKDTCNGDSSKNDEIFKQCQKQRYYYMEDESIFDMPGLLNDMAEGLLLSPPPYLNGDYTWDMDNTEKYSDMNLWNHHM